MPDLTSKLGYTFTVDHVFLLFQAHAFGRRLATGDCVGKRQRGGSEKEETGGKDKKTTQRKRQPRKMLV